MNSMQSFWAWTSWRICVVVFCLTRMYVSNNASHLGSPWRETKEYPAAFDHFYLYVTNSSQPLTGERAMLDGCGTGGRPYKYRGEGHIPVLRRALTSTASRVWVGALDTTSPWRWTSGDLLYKPIGTTATEVSQGFNLPGNNAFLCALECQGLWPQWRYLLLQGNKCRCSETRPHVRPADRRNIRRCPGSYEEDCGTVNAFSVYINTLSNRSVQWASLVERERHYATAAFLYRSDKTGSLQLKAVKDQRAVKGYICNVTFYSKDNNSNNNNNNNSNNNNSCSRYPWVQQGPLTWERARTACTNNSGRLLELPSDEEALTVIAAEQALCRDNDYWVGLSRRSASLWLDGTPVKVPILYPDFGKTACLTMLMTATGPNFTFEGCGGIALPALCEKDTDVHTNTFTHDDQGNHLNRSTTAKIDDYSLTVSILIAALVILTLLTLILGIFLCNKKLLIPRKAALQTSFGKMSGTADQAPSQAGPMKQASREDRPKRKRYFFSFPKKSSKTCKRQKSEKEEILPKVSTADQRGSLAPAMSLHASYAIVNKSGPKSAAFAPAHRPQTIGSDADPHLYPDSLYGGASPPGSVVEYTEVSLRDLQDVDNWSAYGGLCRRAPGEVLPDQGREGMAVAADGNASGDDGLLMKRRVSSSSELVLSPMALYGDYEIPANCLVGMSDPPAGLFAGPPNGPPDKAGSQVAEALRHDFLRPTVKLMHTPRRADSSQSSTTGSDDAYSVLNYRQQINRAWTGLHKSQAYSHVIVGNMPVADVSSARADRGLTRHHSLDHHDVCGKLSQASFVTEAPAPDMRHGADRVTGGPYDVAEGVYDVAHSAKPLQRPRCIDNVYDHAEPLQSSVGMRKCSASAVSHLLRPLTSWPPTSQSAPNTPSQRQRTLSYSYTVPHMRTLSQTFAAGAMSLTRSESEV